MGSKDTIFSLHEEELSLLSDPSFFIKKKLVTSRIIDLFGELESDFERICQQHGGNLPDTLKVRRGKISRGENYRGLPYVILDHPAVFSKEGIFAFRTLMWWGNAFSFTFHLSGSYLNNYLDKIPALLSEMDQETLICINNNQWEHHYESSNYVPIPLFLDNTKNSHQYIAEKGFIKLSRVVPLSDHKKLVPTGIQFLDAILTKLK